MTASAWMMMLAAWGVTVFFAVKFFLMILRTGPPKDAMAADPSVSPDVAVRRCPHCQENNQPAAVYCARCGTPLPAPGGC